jgi:3-oxoacyl-[acyl-carrier-protein] synthase III
VDRVITGIVSAACHFPQQRRSARELFAEEGLGLSPDTAARLGIEEVPLCTGHQGSELAVAASLEALARANVSGADVDVVVDYTIWRLEYERRSAKSRRRREGVHRGL